MQPSEALDFVRFLMIVLAVGCLAGFAVFVPIIMLTWPKRRG